MTIRKVPTLDGSDLIFDKFMPARLASGAVAPLVASRVPDANLPARLGASELSATFAATAPTPAARKMWAASTAYAAGDKVVNAQGELVQATTAHAGDVSYDTAKWAVVRSVAEGFARLEQHDAPALRSFQSVPKGRIGTAGAAPVALRFDDWQNDINTLGMSDEMYNRGLVWSLACISRQDVQAWFTSAVTGWTTVQTWVRRGAEIFSHGLDHQSPYDADPAVWYQKMYDQIVTSKRELESKGFRVQGWAMPGVAAPGYGSFLYAEDEWNTDAGRLLTSHYPIVETDAVAPYLELPTDARLGLCHFTISDTAYTLASLQAIVNKAIRTRTGVELMTHFGNLGDAGMLPTATFWAFMDWLVTQRDAGLITIVTPSSLPYCDPGATTRPDLLSDSRFSSTATGAATEQVWQNIDGVNNARAFVNDGPNGGTDVLRINTIAGAAVLQTPQAMQQRNLNGTTLMAVMKARSVGGVATLKVRQEALTPYAVAVEEKSFPLTTAWTTIRMPYTPHISTNVGSFGLTSTAGVVEVTDTHLYVA